MIPTWKMPIINSYNLIILNISVIVFYNSVNPICQVSVKSCILFFWKASMMRKHRYINIKLQSIFSFDRNKISIRIERQFRFEFLKKYWFEFFFDSKFLKSIDSDSNPKFLSIFDSNPQSWSSYIHIEKGPFWTKATIPVVIISVVVYILYSSLLRN